MRSVVLAVIPALFLAGCITYSSTPQPLISGPPVCMYGGEPYSPGARIYPPSSAPLQCQSDGSWSPQ